MSCPVSFPWLKCVSGIPSVEADHETSLKLQRVHEISICIDNP